MRAAFLSVLLLAACAATPAPEPAPSGNHIAGTAWQRVDDENANPHGATLQFTDRGAAGHTGCNRWFAAVTQNGEALRFGNIGMTRMACQTGMQADTERNFLAVLRAARYAHYDEEVLILLDEQQNQIATFSRTATADEN